MKKLTTLAGAVAVLSLTGCASTTPYWDANFGDATRGAMALQVIEPDASLNTDPVTGMDGKAAHGVMSEYGKTFTQPQPQPQFFTIGVGGGSGR